MIPKSFHIPQSFISVLIQEEMYVDFFLSFALAIILLSGAEQVLAILTKGHYIRKQC